MKKIIYFLAATVFMLNSCQDDEFEKQTGTTQSGDGILFSTSLSEGLETRTVYADEPTTDEEGKEYYPVSWEGHDTIAIYCPQSEDAENSPVLAYYDITPSNDDQTVSSAVTSIGNGLKWGSAQEHHFYGFYPGNKVTGTEDGKIVGEIPTTQNVTKWKKLDDGKTYYGVANTDFAYMWAYGTANRETIEDNEPVNMVFHPWMTILDIEINGPATNEGAKTVTNINIKATGNQSMLAGEFICDMTPVENGTATAPKYIPVTGSESEVNNTISISCYDNENDKFITLNSGEKIIVRAFLLPIDDQSSVDARNIEISVATIEGQALKRTLGSSNEEHGANSIVPHKVNKVILPELTTINPNYWLSSLDPNIYLSELSLPGSKFAYATESNNANPVYQTQTIKQQFLDGVRAFIVQVKANATYHGTRNGGGYPSYTYELTDATLPIEQNNQIELEETITDIADELAAAEEKLKIDNNLECAVVMLTYSGGGGVNATFTGDYPSYGNQPNNETVGGSDIIWMDAIEHRLKELSTITGKSYSGRIYTDEITPNTTLDDVKGKIIFKVNYNTDAQAKHVDANAEIPALFSMWDQTINTVDLKWGSPNINSTNLYWMYHEATHVSINNYSTEITWANKQAQVIQVLTNSVTAYQNNDLHNTWFMVDGGGTYYEGYEYDDHVKQLTKDLNPILIRTLQTRGENASTGLVFINFADKQAGSGQEYRSDEIIQTIIDNNFKFNLRKRSN